MLTGISNQSQVESKVVDRGNLHGKQFLRLEQMMEICLRVYAVDITSVRVDGGEVGFPFLVAHVHGTLIGEQHRIASITGRHDTVEHIDTTLYRLKDVLGVPTPIR